MGKYIFSRSELDSLKKSGFTEAEIRSGTVTVYTYHDFVSGRGIGPFFGRTGEVLPIRDGDSVSIYVLPQSHSTRIMSIKERWYFSFVDEIHDLLKVWYAEKCAKSGLPKKEVNKMILKKLRYDNLEKATFCIYGPKRLVLSKKVQLRHGSIKYWYDRILVQGNGGLPRGTWVAGIDIGKSVFEISDKQIFYACAIDAIFDFMMSIGYRNW